MNDVFNCLNEKKNQNLSVHCLKLAMLTKVFRKVRMRISFPIVVILPHSIIIIIITMMMMTTVIKIIITT